MGWTNSIMETREHNRQVKSKAVEMFKTEVGYKAVAQAFNI